MKILLITCKYFVYIINKLIYKKIIIKTEKKSVKIRLKTVK